MDSKEYQLSFSISLVLTYLNYLATCIRLKNYQTMRNENSYNTMS